MLLLTFFVPMFFQSNGSVTEFIYACFKSSSAVKNVKSVGATRWYFFGMKIFIIITYRFQSVSMLIGICLYVCMSVRCTRYLTKARLNLLRILHVHSSYLGPEAY